MSVITCEIVGGLGNQFFQLFAIIAYAIRTGRKAIFSNIRLLPKNITRPTYWDTIFKEIDILGGLRPPEEIENIPFVYGEPHHTYTPIPIFPLTEEKIRIGGYFQSERYFREEYDTIRGFLRIPEQRNNIQLRFTDYFVPSHTTISMHFRRGDYKNSPTIHPILDDTYYREALRTMTGKVVGGEGQNIQIDVLYFCEAEDNEEIAKVVEGLSLEFPAIHFIKVEDTVEDWEQLLLMSCCNHHIIANSSFSWWGAYLNENTDKIVCFPKWGVVAWFDTSDFYPKEWTLVEGW